MIRCDDIHLSFGSNQIFEGFNAEFSPAETVLLTGVNGAGKSALLNVICGLSKPQRGVVSIDGLSVPAAIAAGHVGYIMQRPTFPLLVKVRDVARYVATMCGDRARDPFEAAKRFGIDDLLDRETGGLSGGEQRKLGLALAWISHPKTLMALDEPEDSLDEVGRSVLHDFVQECHDDGVAIVVVTHQPDEWDENTTRRLSLSAEALA